jgi:hypothetical protein
MSLIEVSHRFPQFLQPLASSSFTFCYYIELSYQSTPRQFEDLKNCFLKKAGSLKYGVMQKALDARGNVRGSSDFCATLYNMYKMSVLCEAVDMV